MNFELSEQHKMLAQSIRSFVEKEIEPLAEQIDREDEFPEWIWRRLGELGWLGVTIPEKYGGAGFDYLAQAIVCEEISRSCPALALSEGAHSNLCCDNLYRNGTEEQRFKYLPPLCTGDKIGALALTEPNAGSDAVGIQLRATKDGGYYVLNGAKTFITNGSIADTLIVYAKTEPEKGARGITAFIVEKDFPGSFTSTHIKKMGYRGSPTAELSFQEYRVPCQNVLGKENQGIRVMMSGLDTERAIFCGLALGIASRALELSVEYAKERVQFGQPIGKFQLIQGKLADMYTALEASSLLTYKATTLAAMSEKGGKGTEIHKVAAAAILFSAETATKAAMDAVQIHGGYGYTLDNQVNRLYRDAKLLEIGAGTSEVRRLVIAEALLQEG
jgi:isovaleryl-CoA dehydrogenase (EC 1.3.99.10)